MLRDGLGVTRNLEESAYWAKLARMQGIDYARPFNIVS